MKDNIWPYLAGIFDGEGSIALNYRMPEGKTWPHFFCQIIIYNTSLPLMKWLVKNVGGVYYTRPVGTSPLSKLTQYVWHPSGRNNRIKFLLAILPYSVIRRERIKLALEYLRLGYGQAEERKRLVAKCKELNQNGESVEANTRDADEESAKIESELVGDNESAPDVNLGPEWRKYNQRAIIGLA
jgi:hypothetical protein